MWNMLWSGIRIWRPFRPCSTQNCCRVPIVPPAAQSRIDLIIRGATPASISGFLATHALEDRDRGGYAGQPQRREESLIREAESRSSRWSCLHGKARCPIWRLQPSRRSYPPFEACHRKPCAANRHNVVTVTAEAGTASRASGLRMGEICAALVSRLVAIYSDHSARNFLVSSRNNSSRSWCTQCPARSTFTTRRSFSAEASSA